MYTQTHINKHSKHHHQDHSKLHKRTTSMHSMQWHTLKTQKNQIGVPQGGVLCSALFNIYTSDIPLPPKNVQITTYADDITITTFHTKHCKSQYLFNHISTKHMNGPPLMIFI